MKNVEKLHKAFYEKCPLVKKLIDAKLMFTVSKQVEDLPQVLESGHYTNLTVLPLIMISEKFENDSVLQAVEVLALRVDNSILEALTNKSIPTCETEEEATQVLMSRHFYGPFEKFGSNLMVQMTQDVVRLVIGMEPRVEGNEVQCIMVPQVRVDSQGNVGVARVLDWKG
jgi:hypothetical protein